MGWETTEYQAFVWYKDNYDIDADYKGGSDSTMSDIYSPKLHCYIEVKDLTAGARCGQFVVSQALKDKFLQCLIAEPTEDMCKEFVRRHYTGKNVEYFIVYDGQYHLLTMADFLGNYTFSLQSYAKKSGTSVCPKKYLADVLAYDDSFYLDNGRPYCNDEEMWGEYIWLDDTEFFISQKNFGEIRKCSSTKNQTWLVQVQ